ncbi:MAG TPA: hypothetical protein VGF45_12530 [Polyangia bacterium]
MTPRFHRTLRVLALAAAAFSADALVAENTASAQTTFTVTKNVYSGWEWWGTITFRNNGANTTSSYQVEFDVPSGVKCTNDYAPPGATLSPLNSSNTATVSNHCVFTWTNTTPLAPGQTKTFNYSTNSQSFNQAYNIRIKDNEAGAVCSTFAVTQNHYNGRDWWGTITIKNGGPYTSYNYKVEFDVPAGSHCTNDYVPPGATLSPLNGTGPSARTVSNHCVYSWTNGSPIYSGSSKTFNYSTDTQNFSSAANIKAYDNQTCVGGTCIAQGAVCDPLDTVNLCCTNNCVCPPAGGCSCGIEL